MNFRADAITLVKKNNSSQRIKGDLVSPFFISDKADLLNMYCQ
jgi:hypothetical protein